MANIMTRNWTSWKVPAKIRAQIAAISPEIGREPIARMFGIHESTVRAIRIEYGVPLMPRGGRKVWGAQMHARGANREIGWPFRPRNLRLLEWAA